MVKGKEPVICELLANWGRVFLWDLFVFGLFFFFFFGNIFVLILHSSIDDLVFLSFFLDIIV